MFQLDGMCYCLYVLVNADRLCKWVLGSRLFDGLRFDGRNVELRQARDSSHQSREKKNSPGPGGGPGGRAGHAHAAYPPTLDPKLKMGISNLVSTLPS